MKKLYFLLAIVPLFICSICFSQFDSSKYIISRKLLKVEDGLASNEVLYGMQDSRGFLWFGTRNGLNRYDGKNFVLFTKQKNNIRANKVLQLAEDGSGYIWMLYGSASSDRGSLSKIDIYNFNTNKVVPFTTLIKNIPFEESSINWMQQIENKEIMIITNQQDIWIYNSTKGFRLRHRSSEARSLNIRLSYFSENFIMNCFSGGIEFIYNDTSTVVLINIYCPLVKKNKNIEFASEKNEMFLYDSHLKFVPENKNIPLNVPVVLAYDYSSNSALYYYKGGDNLVCYNGSEIISLLNKKQNHLNNNISINNCFTDKSGNKWISTSEGVWKVSIQKNKFTHYFSASQAQANTVNFNNQVRGIYADSKGYVYASVWNVLAYSPIYKPDSVSVTPNIEIGYAVLKANNKMYTCTNLISEYDIEKNKIIPLGDSGYIGEIWALHQLNDSILIEGGSAGTVKFNTNTHKSKRIRFTKLLIYSSFMYSFATYANKEFWAVCENGLFLFDANANPIDCYSEELKDSLKHLPFGTLRDLHIDNDGIFWITTGGEGLWSWDRKNNHFHQYTIADGLPTNLLYCIKEDDENNLWISSDLGLIRFNKKELTTYNYTIDDGLSHNEFNRTSAFKAEDGRMYFGGLNGVNAFYPKDFTSDKNQLNIPLRVISVSQISGSDDKLEDKTLDYTNNKELTFNPGDRYASIEFMLLDYSDGKKRYGYKVEGLDKEWNYTFDNKINVSGLPYGNYTLKIKGQFPNGQWSTSELSIPLFVLKPFYLKSWFIILSNILIIIFIFLFIRSRTQRLNKDKIRLQQEVENQTSHLNNALVKEKQLLGEKEVLLKEVHHRVKNNLQVISGLLELQSKSVTDKAAQDALLEGRSRVRSVALIHQNLYQFENLGSIELNVFVTDLQKQLNSIFNKGNFKIDFINHIPFTEIDIDTAVPLGLVINELFTNSYKYAFQDFTFAKIEIHLQTFNEKEGRKFILKYKDSGIGLPKNFDITKAKSLGLRLIGDLCKQLKGSVKYEYDNGSKFTIEFTDREARKNFE